MKRYESFATALQGEERCSFSIILLKTVLLMDIIDICVMENR
jgi:hypothetical protein